MNEFLVNLNVDPNDQLESGSNDTGSRRDYSELMIMDQEIEKARINNEINSSAKRRISNGLGIISETGIYDV